MPVVETVLRRLALRPAGPGDTRSDALTGVGNRLAWDETLQLLQHDLRAAGKPQSIVAVDVDGLAAVNELDGRSAGDELLRVVAATLREAVRGGDVVARTGGDEFAILMRDTDADACLTRVERLERALAERRLSNGRHVGATVRLVEARAPRA